MAETTYLLPHCIDGENVSECMTCLGHLQNVVAHIPAWGVSLVNISINPEDVTITLSDALTEEQADHVEITLVE